MSYVTSGYMKVGAQQGWQCPVCGRVLAPFITECPCQGMGKQTITTTGTDIETVPFNGKSESYTITYPSTLIEAKKIVATKKKAKHRK